MQNINIETSVSANMFLTVCCTWRSRFPRVGRRRFLRWCHGRGRPWRCRSTCPATRWRQRSCNLMLSSPLYYDVTARPAIAVGRTCRQCTPETQTKQIHVLECKWCKFVCLEWISGIIYHLQTKFGEGNVFTDVCLFTWDVGKCTMRYSTPHLTPCYWHLVVIIRDMFRTYPSQVLTSCDGHRSGWHTSYWNVLLEKYFWDSGNSQMLHKRCYRRILLVSMLQQILKKT